MSTTLFDKYGGFGTVSKIVMDFYERALDDDQIGDYFADVDMPKLIDHQTKFISSLLGGPASFSDDRLKQVHRHLELTDADMNAMAALLAETLADHGVSGPDVATVLQAVESKRPLIVFAKA